MEERSIESLHQGQFTLIKLIQKFFLFLLNNVFVVASNPKAKRKKLVFFFTLLTHLPLTEAQKNKAFNFLSIYFGLIATIKNIKREYIRENIVPCWFYATSIKIWRIISKARSPLLLICRQNSIVDYVKPIV